MALNPVHVVDYRLPAPPFSPCQIWVNDKLLLLFPMFASGGFINLCENFPVGVWSLAAFVLLGHGHVMASSGCGFCFLFAFGECLFQGAGVQCHVGFEVCLGGLSGAVGDAGGNGYLQERLETGVFLVVAPAKSFVACRRGSPWRGGEAVESARPVFFVVHAKLFGIWHYIAERFS